MSDSELRRFFFGTEDGYDTASAKGETTSETAAGEYPDLKDDGSNALLAEADIGLESSGRRFSSSIDFERVKNDLDKLDA